MFAQCGSISSIFHYVCTIIAFNRHVFNAYSISHVCAPLPLSRVHNIIDHHRVVMSFTTDFAKSKGKVASDQTPAKVTPPPHEKPRFKSHPEIAPFVSSPSSHKTNQLRHVHFEQGNYCSRCGAHCHFARRLQQQLSIPGLGCCSQD